MKDKKFDPKAFLNAKTLSPLEEETLVGGIAAKRVVTVTVTVTVNR